MSTENRKSIWPNGQAFNESAPKESCPYGWCGDGTRGCGRPECIQHAQGIGASSPEPSSARTTADSPVAVLSDAPNPSIEQSPAPVSQRVLTKGGEEDPWVVARLAAWKKKPPTNDDPEDDDATKNARADLREEMDACGWDIYGGSDYHIIVGMNYAWEEGFLEARAQSYRNPTPPSQELIRAGDAMERSIEFSTHQEEGDPCDGCGYDYGKGHSFGCHINGLKDAAAAWRSAKQSGFTPSTQ